MFKFSDFLIFCSGANRHYLDQCPNERHKFYPIGLSILVTTSLAMISMYYAANMIFGKSEQGNINQGFIILFSIFWGVAIFSIDWGLVKTMRKPREERSFLRELVTPPVLFRIAVAIIISFSISRPIEVAIYEKRLKAQVGMDQLAFIQQEIDRRAQENKEQLFSPLDSLKNDNEKITKIIADGPQSLTFKENSEALKICRDEYTSLKANNNNKINNLRGSNRRIRNDPSSYDTIYQKLTKDALRQIRKNDNEIESLKKMIDSKDDSCQVILNKMNKESDAHSEKFGKLIDSNAQMDTLLRGKLASKLNKDSLVVKEIEDKAKISFDPQNPGLITSLESLANFEKTPEGKKVWIVRLILLLIFICIDTAPIVVKVLTKRGPYEEILEAEEEKMRYLATAEKNANMLLISNIAAAQNRILRHAVNRYENEELERLRQEPSYFREIVQKDSSESGAQSNQNISSHSNNASNSTEA